MQDPTCSPSKKAFLFYTHLLLHSRPVFPLPFSVSRQCSSSSYHPLSRLSSPEISVYLRGRVGLKTGSANYNRLALILTNSLSFSASDLKEIHISQVNWLKCINIKSGNKHFDHIKSIFTKQRSLTYYLSKSRVSEEAREKGEKGFKERSMTIMSRTRN